MGLVEFPRPLGLKKRGEKDGVGTEVPGGI